MKQRILMRSEYNFFSTASTRWRDMDTLGHINHTVYLGLLETKLKEFVDHLHNSNEHEFGLQSTAAGLLASMKVMYIKQVHHPAKLDIGYRITRIGSKSYDVHQGIFLKEDDEPAFQSIHTFVMFNFVEQKSILVVDLIKNNLREVE